MISAPPSYILEPNQTETLLYRLKDWKSGICPNGKLANSGCFVLEKMPSIIVRPEITKPVATRVVTDSEWTDNLVKNGIIQHINDSALITTLADLNMIFNTSVLHQVNYGEHKVHAIQIRKYATISMDAILRPTHPMKESIEMALAETDIERRWDKLLKFWDEYGYFWPRKIIFGFKTYFEKKYTFRDQYEHINNYYRANSKLGEKLNRSRLQITDDINEFLEECEIVGRNDLIPLHELLDNEWRERVEQLIKVRFVRILVNQPIKIYNRSKKSYLCWSPRPIDNILVVKLLQAGDVHTEKESQYLWNLNWTSKKNVTPTAGLDYTTTNYRPQIIRGSEKVYIFPACKTKINTKEPAVSNEPSTSQSQSMARYLNTENMILSCPSYQYQSAPQPDPRSRIRPLKLSLAKEQITNEIANWSIEYHHNRLKYAMDADYHIKLNINEHIRRVKPLIQGDEIRLQQIGLLTAFDTDVTTDRPSTSSPILHGRKPKYFQQKEALSSKSKRSVKCMDEDMVQSETLVADTYWIIQLATVEDQQRHYIGPRNTLEQLAGNLRPNLSTSHTTTRLENGYPSHHQRQQQQQRNGSAYGIRRTQSDSSVPTLSTTENHEDTSTHFENHEDRAAYFESLAKSSTSKLLMKFMKKVTLQPLVQFVNPSRTRQSPNSQQIPPDTAIPEGTQPNNDST